MKRILSILAFSLACLGASPLLAAPLSLLNVSYDPTREFYEDLNQSFIAYWKKEHGETVEIAQSHGGSAKQARSVIDGLKADVVTLALAYDIDVIAEKTKLLPENWQQKLPHNSSPYTSTVVFLVRKGNPKSIHDWDDLVRGDVQVIMPNPKTSGGARWNYLAAWAYAMHKTPKDEGAARGFMAALYKHVPVLDTGARASTMTFVQRRMGDVLVTWENEAFLAQEEMGKDQFEIVVPSLSIKAEPPVAVIEKNTAAKGTTEIAKAYLDYLYSHTGQELAAKHYYRPTDPDVAYRFKGRFPDINMVTVEELGGWKKLQAEHFADGGVFDRIYIKK